MKVFRFAETKRARIEMIPLIDIIFLLLVFFIYAMLSMALHRGIRVKLPTASTADVDTEDHLTITITADDKLFLNKQPVTMEGLVSRIKAMELLEKKPVVFINGDEGADLRLAIKVLDVLRLHGVMQVSFLALPERWESPR